ncbi:cytochrome P450 716B1-like [Ananas comosus]|uniref:Cytochrome P450 716B1-like n=2 Tax=Ananas comosus TaxID=4615 RepID=A0A6P5EPK1_ANACO|nr:cytochrome P450 716B1-like [Ananas comosus]CAD1841004.1 unnamed protein product [Ananas comosus var. bracteatus]
MDTTVLILLFLSSLPLFYLLAKQKPPKKKLPPGPFGFPVIGQSLSLFRALRTNTGEQWLEQKVRKFGPVLKLSLFGHPTVFLAGQAANKLVFGNDTLTPRQTRSFTSIMGRQTMREMIGDDHRRLRAAFGQFLKPDVLKKYVSKIDEEVRYHIKMNWTGQQTVTVTPLMKCLTFDIMCSLIFGLDRGDTRQALATELVDMVAGMWSIPLNIPFTRFNKSMKASRRARRILSKVIQERRRNLDHGLCSPHADLITCLLSLNQEGCGNEALSEEEIIDNTIFAMVAGHDTTAVLITFMIRQLAKDPAIHAKVAREQEGIAKSKTPGETLTWDDLNKMKYTWRVALETLRMIPPVFGSFRKALKDVEFNGYLIPKGWHVFWASSMTQMNADIFHEPHKFDPTRFENQSSIPPYCFIAFGGGSRICPGNEFARIETLVAMHYIVTQFRWKLSGEDDGFTRYPLPSPSQGLTIKLEPKGDM